MPFASHRGQRIHYAVHGDGPLVLLQHGLLVDGQSWNASGFVEGLADRFTVVVVDSLGHGLSDRPSAAALYGQKQRAGDLVAVIDDLGAERVHLVGHSMGGWMAVGMAKYHPERLASLTIAGWDLVRGTVAAAPPGTTRQVPFDAMLGWARRTVPELVAWVTPEDEPGLLAAWDALTELEGAAAAGLGAKVPVLLWNGRDDPYHDPMRAFATSHGLEFLSTPGDHMGAVISHGAESAKGVRAFLEAAS